MEKEKIAICMEDKEYQARFVRCIMNHYRDRFELYILDDIESFSKSCFSFKEEDVMLISDQEPVAEVLCEKSKVLVLQENDLVESTLETIYVQYTEKYQEVYKIVEKMEYMMDKLQGKKVQKTGKNDRTVIGVFSLEKEAMQLPFSVLLAETLGEKKKVLLMDIQPFSGLGREQQESDSTFGLEDLLSVASSGVYTQKRLMSSIGHEQKWDYIYPAKNTACLTEVSESNYQQVIDLLISERGYEVIIINFGSVFSGMIKLMEHCNQFYFLKASRDACNWRENAFLEEIQRQEMEEFLRSIMWIEIPREYIRENSWRQLAKLWLWGTLGDQIREQNWMEKKDGAYS